MVYFMSSHDNNCAQNELTGQLHESQTDRQTDQESNSWIKRLVNVMFAARFKC